MRYEEKYIYRAVVRRARAVRLLSAGCMCRQGGKNDEERQRKKIKSVARRAGMK